MIEKDLLFDVRILQRNLEKGLISQADVDKHMAALKDLKGQFRDSEVVVEPGEFDLSLVERVSLPMEDDFEELDDEE